MNTAEQLARPLHHRYRVTVDGALALDTDDEADAKKLRRVAIDGGRVRLVEIWDAEQSFMLVSEVERRVTTRRVTDKGAH